MWKLLRTFWKKLIFAEFITNDEKRLLCMKHNQVVLYLHEEGACFEQDEDSASNQQL